MLVTDGRALWAPWRKCSGSPFDRYAQCHKDVKQPHQNSTPPSCVYSKRYVTHHVSTHMHSSIQVLYDIMPWTCGLLEIHFLIPFISRQLSFRTDYEDCLYRRSSIWPFTSTASVQPNSQTTCNWFFKISGWFSHGMYSFEVGWTLVALSKFPKEKKTNPSGPIVVIVEVLKVSILQLYSAFNYSTGLFDW
jgi:hypothetical protein